MNSHRAVDDARAAAVLLEAMAAERLFRALDLPGKLIPVPRKLTSDCGLAWSAPAETGPQAEDALRRRSLGFDGVYAMEL